MHGRIGNNIDRAKEELKHLLTNPFATATKKNW